MTRIKLVLKDAKDLRIWDNAERTAKRVAKWPAWKRGCLDSIVEEVDVDNIYVDLGGEGG